MNPSVPVWAKPGSVRRIKNRQHWTTCRTTNGDVLDTICQNYYGHLNGTVEAVLDANQGLADEMQPFRAGVVIYLPDWVVPSDEGVMLWG